MNGDHLDTRFPGPSNLLFEASNNCGSHDNYSFAAHGAEEGDGIYVNFLDEPRSDGMMRVRDNMWLSLTQCREFGEALIRAADGVGVSKD